MTLQFCSGYLQVCLLFVTAHTGSWDATNFTVTRDLSCYHAVKGRGVNWGWSLFCLHFPAAHLCRLPGDITILLSYPYSCYSIGGGTLSLWSKCVFSFWLLILRSTGQHPTLRGCCQTCDVWSVILRFVTVTISLHQTPFLTWICLSGQSWETVGSLFKAMCPTEAKGRSLLKF